MVAVISRLKAYSYLPTYLKPLEFDVYQFDISMKTSIAAIKSSVLKTSFFDDVSINHYIPKYMLL